MFLSVFAYVFFRGSIIAHAIIGTSEKELNGRAEPGSIQEALGYGIDGERYKTACPDYKHYAVVPQYVRVPLCRRLLMGTLVAH